MGAAYGSGALRRHLPAVLAAGRCPLPDEMLEQAGVAGDRIMQDQAALTALREALRREGEAFLREADGPPLRGAGRVALLPLVLARRDLRQAAGRLPATPRGRGLGDRLAVLAAALGRS